MVSNTNNNKIPPLPIWAILFKPSSKPETFPSVDSQETQLSVPKESIYKEKIQSNKKFDTRVNWDNIKWLQKFFHENLMEDKDAAYNKSLGIISNILKESFGEPTTKQDGGGPGYGLLQWTKGKDRYKKMMEYKTDSIIQGVDPELQRQAEFILNSIKDPNSGEWHDGGSGSGYMRAKDAQKDFMNPNNRATKSSEIFTTTFVRPKNKSEIKERGKLIPLLDSLYNTKYMKIIDI